MKIKGISDTFTDYKKTSMLISTVYCDFKCENEGLCPRGSCHNASLIDDRIIEVSNESIIRKFKSSDIYDAIIFGELEPMMQFDEIYEFIKEFRVENLNDIIIFTGYYPEEIQDQINRLKSFKNIIIKYGRFIANSSSRFDEVLGVSLISNNQYAVRL